MKKLLLTLGLLATASVAFAQAPITVKVDCSPVKDPTKKTECETLNDGKTYATKEEAEATRKVIIDALVKAGVPQASAEKGVTVVGG